MQNPCSNLKCSLFTHGVPPYLHCNQRIITSKPLQEMSYNMVQLLISGFKVCVAVLTSDLFWNTSVLRLRLLLWMLGWQHPFALLPTQRCVPCVVEALLGVLQGLCLYCSTQTQRCTLFPLNALTFNHILPIWITHLPSIPSSLSTFNEQKLAY